MTWEPRFGRTAELTAAKGRSKARAVAASALILLCLACGGPTNYGATTSGSCVGPYLSNQPPSGPFRGKPSTVDPGETITVYGHWYTHTCNDTGGDKPLKPLPPVHLFLTLPDGDAQSLGTFHPAGSDMGFSTTIRVPAQTPAGTAIVHDDQRYPSKYRFHIGR